MSLHRNRYAGRRVGSYRLVALLAILAIFLTACVRQAEKYEPKVEDLDLVINGQANATIVIARDAGEKIINAAADLQDHIRKMTGALIKIGFDDVDREEGNLILLGPSRYTAELGIEEPTNYPNGEKVILKRIDRKLILMGNDEMTYLGSQFAVNMFLELQGCGWFGPDELWQVVPEKKDIKVGKLDIVHTPKFVSRQSNVYHHYQAFSRRWYMGGEPTVIGHTLPRMVSRENYFESNPEWFSLINGKRDPYAEYWWQYCYSNKDFAAEIGRKVIEYFDNNPAAMQYSIMENDGWDDGWCECPECSAFPSNTDLILHFANNVARVVAKKYPDRRVTMLSYHSTYFAPKSNIKAEPNLEVMFTRETNMTQPLDVGFDVGRSVFPETRNSYPEPWKTNFSNYIKKTNLKNVAIWEWYCLSVERPIWKDIPWVQGNVAIRNQKLWKDNGASYVYYDHGPLPAYNEGYSSFALRWPLWYVAAKGMWDASLTGEDILRDACNKLYGKGAYVMFKYYMVLADISEMCTARSIAWVPPRPGEMYTIENRHLVDEAINEAKKVLDQVEGKERERMENQIELWEKAAFLISNNVN